MSDEFTVKVSFIKRNGVTVEKKNRRIVFTDRTLELLSSRNEDPDVYQRSMFLYKPLKKPAPGTKVLTLFLDPVASQDKYLKFHFDMDTYIPWVVDKFNKLINYNKDLTVKKEKPKPPVVLKPTNPLKTPTKSSERTYLPSRLTGNRPPRVAPLFSHQPDSQKPKIAPKVAPIAPVQRSLLPENPRNSEEDRPIPERIPTSSSSRNDYWRDEGFENYHRIDKFKYKSLANTGNSCYINSTLQALSSCPSLVSRSVHLLRDILARKELGKLEDYELGHKFRIFWQFLELMTTLGEWTAECTKDTKTRFFDRHDLQKFRVEIGRLNGEFNNDNQHDAHELLVTLFGAVDDIMEQRAKADGLDLNATKIEYGLSLCALHPFLPFRIVTETLYTCPECSNAETRKETTRMLSLAVEENITVETMLFDYFKTNMVEKTCSKCGEEKSLTKDRIETFPETFCLHLKWYETKGHECFKKKCTVLIPLEIDVTPLSFYPQNDEFPQDFWKIFEKNEKTEDEEKENVRILGGFSEEDDLIVDDVKEPKDMYFRWVSDEIEISRMMEIIGIQHNERALSNHLKLLQALEVSKMEKFATPTQTKRIDSDGNCFFRAISWSLTGSESHYKELRRALTSFMEQNESSLGKYVAEDFKGHVDTMRRNGEWATTAEIFGMAELLKITIFTYLTDGGWTAHAPRAADNDEENGAIYLSNFGAHFEPVLCLSRNSARMSRKRKAEEDDEGDRSRRSTTTPETPRREQPTRACRTPVAEKKSCGEKSPAHKYRLVAAVCHDGDSHDRGHYITFTRSRLENKWLRCSDDYIREIDEDRVADVISQQAYILFYDRI